MNKCVLFLGLIFTITACSGGSGSAESGSTEKSTKTVSGKIQFKGFADASIGAHIEVFNAYTPKQRICETQSENGLIELPEDCIKADNIYLVKASAVLVGVGVNVDDVTPMLSALMSGAELIDGPVWSISTVSDTLWQSLQNYLSTEPEKNAVLSAMDRVAALLLTTDGNGDGVINRRDIAVWQTGDPSAIDGLISISNYVVDRTEIVQLSPHEQVFIGHLDTLQPAQLVLLNDELAYVATRVSVLVVDISDKTKPRLISAYPTGWIHDMELMGDSLYLALGDKGIERLDISDPKRLESVALIDHPANKLLAYNGRLYLVTKIADDIVFAMLDKDVSKDSIDSTDNSDSKDGISISQRLFLPEHRATVFKAVNQKLMVCTTTVLESRLIVLDPQTLVVQQSISLQDDLDLLPGIYPIDLFYANNEIQMSASLIAANVYLFSINPQDYSLLGKTDERIFSLVSKNDMMVMRSDSYMFLVDPEGPVDADGFAVWFRKVLMPEEVKLQYQEDVLGDVSTNSADAWAKKGAALDYLKRFQLSDDFNFAFFASDRFGFSIISLTQNEE